MNSLSRFAPGRWLALLVLAVLSVVSARAQVDIYLKFTPTNSSPVIAGDSTAARYPGNEGWFLVKNFSIGAANSVTIGGAAGGGGSGKLQFLDFVLGKDVNKGSPTLFQMMAAGQHAGFAQLVVVKSGGNGLPYLTYDFKTVFLTSQEWLGENDGIPTEKLRMAFGAFRITYRPQNPDGTLGTAVTGQWNIINNTPTF